MGKRRVAKYYKYCVVLSTVFFLNHRECMIRKVKKETMPQQRKLDCPVCNCNHPSLTDLSDYLIHSHNISCKERKALLQRARFSILSRQPDQPKPSIPETDSTPTQFGNSLPKTSPLPEQKKLPNPVPSNSTSH